MTTALAFIVTLGVLVIIHEYGHYRVALACGVKVERFSFGFGPVLWRYQRSPDSTEFTLSALPLGGYVRMLGHGPDPVPPGLHDQAFRNKTLWQRCVRCSPQACSRTCASKSTATWSSWLSRSVPSSRTSTSSA